MCCVLYTIFIAIHAEKNNHKADADTFTHTVSHIHSPSHTTGCCSMKTHIHMHTKIHIFQMRNGWSTVYGLQCRYDVTLLPLKNMSEKSLKILIL